MDRCSNRCGLMILKSINLNLIKKNVSVAEPKSENFRTYDVSSGLVGFKTDKISFRPKSARFLLIYV